MLVLPVVAGTLTLLTVVVGVAAVRALPVRWACPECHHATAPVRRALLRPLSALIQWRWCPRCHWSGLSRKGKRGANGMPRDLGTGFQWGDGNGRPRRARWAFRWKGEAEARTTPVVSEPVHASGFRWGPGERPPDDPAHPSGFEWADEESPDPAGFEWADDEPPEPPGFEWGEGLADGSSLSWDRAAEPDAFGFRWGE